MTTTTRRLLLAALALATIAAAACGPRRHRAPSDDPVIIFDNQSLTQADVFILARGASPMRIGTVFGGRRETLRVRTGMVAGGTPVNIIARLFATNRAVTSGLVSLARGDTIAVTLPSDERTLSVLPAGER